MSQPVSKLSPPSFPCPGHPMNARESVGGANAEVHGTRRRHSAPIVPNGNVLNAHWIEAVPNQAFAT